MKETRQSRWQRQKRAEGCCAGCGKPSPTWFCDPCADARNARRREWMRAYMAKRRKKAAAKPPGARAAGARPGNPRKPSKAPGRPGR